MKLVWITEVSHTTQGADLMVGFTSSVNNYFLQTLAGVNKGRILQRPWTQHRGLKKQHLKRNVLTEGAFWEDKNPTKPVSWKSNSNM